MKQRRLLPVIDAVLIGVLAAYIVAGTALVPFHGDESTQIYMSRDYAYQFLQGDLALVRYNDPPISATEQQLRLLNGTLPKYLIGFVWHVAGFELSDLNEQWDWGADWQYNVSTGHAPSEALLQVARLPSAIMLALGLIPMFALGKLAGGRRAAYLACLYFALSPPLLINGRRAMMEGALITLSLATVWAGTLFISWDSARWRDRAARVLFLGITAGLAIASKHTAVFTAAAVFGVCAGYPFVTFLLKRTEVRLTYLGGLIPAGIVAFGVFLALNPAWWDAPLSRPFEVLELRNDLLTDQTAAFGGYRDASEAVGGFFRQVLIAQPQYYEIAAWEGYIADQIARYAGSVWRGVAVGGSVIGGVILLALCVIGAIALIWDKTRDAGIRALLIVWAGVMIVSTLALTPLEWGRYYLPVLPVIGLFAAVGIKIEPQRTRRSQSI